MWGAFVEEAQGGVKEYKPRAGSRIIEGNAFPDFTELRSVPLRPVPIGKAWYPPLHSWWRVETIATFPGRPAHVTFRSGSITVHTNLRGAMEEPHILFEPT